MNSLLPTDQIVSELFKRRAQEQGADVNAHLWSVLLSKKHQQKARLHERRRTVSHSHRGLKTSIKSFPSLLLL